MKRPSGVDKATARQLAVAADVDPRTVLRELADPGSVRGMAGHRLRKVLQERYGEGKVEG